MVKDDSGSYAVLSEQGSSALHIMTAAKVLLDVNFRLPHCAGESSETVYHLTAYAQVKRKDAPEFLRLPKSECPLIRIRLPRARCPRSWDEV